MKPGYRWIVLHGLVLLALGRDVVSAADVGTAFTYQGFLEKPAGVPVDDTCDFRFSLYVAPTGGSPVGDSPQTITDVTVNRGTFTTPIDFGASAIDGTARWLAIEVQCTDDADFVPLNSQRVELTPAPYSIRAGSGVGGPNALNVTQTGDVGIGTTTPAAKLDVNGATRTTTLEITGGSLLVPQAVGWGADYFGETDPPFDTVALSAGVNFSLAVRSDGTLVGWGTNGYGQINVPQGTFVAVTAGHYHALAIRTDGTLVGWGADWNGVTAVPSGIFTSVAAAITHSLGIRSNGTLVGWGENTYGQTTIPSGTFTHVAAGSCHSLAIRTDGTLAGWGCNFDGQINVPAGVFIAVSAFNDHSLAIRDDGELFAWGKNDAGQINAPAGTFLGIAAGNSHSLAIRTDGTLAGWGANNEGQINVPSGMFIAVTSGSVHGLAIRADPLAANPALRLLTDSAAKPGSNTWTIWSDRRLKTKIEPLSGALERLLQLRGVTFQWLDPATQGGITGTQMGLIADEVQRAFPQWVGRDPKGYQTLTVGGFEALTAEAFRDLRAEKDRQLAEKERQIDSLDARILDLKSQISDLKKLVESIAEQKASGQ